MSTDWDKKIMEKIENHFQHFIPEVILAHYKAAILFASTLLTKTSHNLYCWQFKFQVPSWKNEEHFENALKEAGLL